MARRRLVALTLFLLALPLTCFASINFLEAPSYTVGEGPYAVVTGDFNKDGKLDLAVPNYISNSVSILLGNGDGTFQAAVNYPVGTHPNSIVVGDFNGDGNLDLAVMCSDPDFNDLNVLLGNGNGTFQPPRYTAIFGTSMQAADFDGDGKLDIVVWGFTGTVPGGDPGVGFTILHGVGDGTFQITSRNILGDGIAWGPVGGVIVADFNGDGKPDVAAFLAGNFPAFSVFINSGNNSFQKVATYLTPNGSITSMIAADFDGDGKLDLATSNSHPGSLDFINVYKGNGDGTFGVPTPYSVGTTIGFMPGAGVLAADFNHDGHVDLLAVGVSMGVLSGNGDGTFQPLQISFGNGLQGQPAVADFNHDGNLDVAVACSCNSVSILLGSGHGGFNGSVAYSAGTLPFNVRAADFNGDGRLDIAVSSADGIDILFGNGDGTMQPPVNYPGSTVSYSMAVADFNHDSKPDLAVGNTYTSFLTVLLNNGDGTFTVTNYPTGANSPFVAAADFNGDGQLDVVQSGTSSMNITIVFGKGDGTFPSKQTYNAGINGGPIVAADFNNDGKPDLALASGAKLIVWMGNGDGTFGAQHAATVPGTARLTSLAVGDFNHDGKLDLAVTDAANNQVLIFLGNGDGTLQTSVGYATGSGPASTAIADFDGDGNLDLVVGNTLGDGISVLQGNGDGTFQPAIRHLAGADVYSMAIGDFNGDGALDLITQSTGLAGVTSQAVNQATSVFANLGGTLGSVSSLLNPSQFHQPINVDVKVAPSVASSIPSGTVTLREDQTVLGSGSLNPQGHASIALSSLGVGMHSMQAFYSGDANFIARSFDPVTQTVQPANSTTALGSSANPAIQTVSFTATVGSPFGTPTGTVVFHDGVNQIGTGTLDNQGVATLGPTALSQGVHQISAIYQSDGNYVSSAAVPLWQVVNSGSQQTTTSLLSSSLNPVLFRRTLTLLTTVNSTSCAPTGMVTFLERGTALGQRGLDNNGQASLDYAKLTIGAHAITAVYEGDSNCGGSISSTLMQYRSPAPRTLPRP